MPTSAPLSEVPTRAGCTILPATSWDFYERFLEEFDECRVPHSYVDGELRIMSPSFRHESPKRFIARLVDTLTEELNIPCRSMGAILLKSALTEKGAEPDEGYLIQNEAALRGRLDYDPTTDPFTRRWAYRKSGCMTAKRWSSNCCKTTNPTATAKRAVRSRFCRCGTSPAGLTKLVKPTKRPGFAISGNGCGQQSSRLNSGEDPPTVFAA